MSQQLDDNTVRQVQDLVFPGYYMEDIQRLACLTAVLPADTGTESLKRFPSEHSRFRGAMETTSIDDFVRYSPGCAKEGEKTRCFIDADDMLARPILNISTLDNPGCVDNAASIKLKKVAPLRTLLLINGDRLNQK